MKYRGQGNVGIRKGDRFPLKNSKEYSDTSFINAVCYLAHVKICLNKEKKSLICVAWSAQEPKKI
jgi:hypothetical protein